MIGRKDRGGPGTTIEEQIEQETVPAEPLKRAGDGGPTAQRDRGDETVNEERLAKAKHDVSESPLGYGEHTELGRVVKPADKAWNQLMRKVHQAGEDLWYEPPSEDVTTTGRLALLGEEERRALEPEGKGVVAAVEWYASDDDASETAASVQVLTQEEYDTVRRQTPSAVIADVIAADDRKRSGQPGDGETLESAAGRLAALMRRD